MPHITVEYSQGVADAFDRPAFAKDVHEAIVTIADGRAAGCKTRFVPLGETFVADGSPHYQMIHVEIALLAGRTPETKHDLGKAALALLREHTAQLPQYEVQFSVDVRDLDAGAYARYEQPRDES
jgi:5-carboxymethyl-2-hydroxymuconate isomerase